MSDAEDPIPQSDLPIRFAMGVVMIGVALVATTFGGWWFRALVAAAAALMLVEWADMHKVPRRWACVAAALTVATLIGAAEYLYAAAEQVDEVPDDLTADLFGPIGSASRRLLAPALLAAAFAAGRDGLGRALYRRAGLRPDQPVLGLGDAGALGVRRHLGDRHRAPISPAARSAGRSSRRGSARTRPGPA